MEFTIMSAYLTETIPTKSPYYQDTAEAYSCSPLIIHGLRESHTYCNPMQFNFSSLDECYFAPKTSDYLSDLLLCQFKRTEHTKNAAQFLSFILRSAIQKTQHNVSTASVETLSLKNLRRYISTLESSLIGQGQGDDVSTAGTENESLRKLYSRIDMIYDYCDIEDQSVVLRYFSEHPQLIGVVKDGLTKLKELFGSNTNFNLKIVKDRESLAPPKLFVYIILPGFLEDSYNILKKFDFEWYLNQSDEILELVAFNIWQ